MIKVIAKITIKENMINDFTRGALELVTESKKESGCITYQLFQDVNIKNEFTFIEEWLTPEALHNHMNSKHFQDIMPKLSALSEKELDISVCTLVF
jgi:quinol monooxygenase YgiN